ncbi:MAG: hypothetical protein RL065_249, partial [Bacteroidota bacterium]
MNDKLHIESVCVKADVYPNHSHI